MPPFVTARALGVSKDSKKHDFLRTLPLNSKVFFGVLRQLCGKNIQMILLILDSLLIKDNCDFTSGEARGGWEQVSCDSKMVGEVMFVKVCSQ